MKKLKSVLALILALAMLVPAGMSLADGADSSELTTVTVLGYNQGGARMGYFKDSKTYEWLVEKTHEMGIDTQLRCGTRTVTPSAACQSPCDLCPRKS